MVRLARLHGVSHGRDKLSVARRCAFRVMRRVPDHAAVEQTVELAKLERGGGHRFANAVMRRATREAEGLVAELTSDSPADAAVLHSHPEWLARMWWDALGREEALGLMARDNEAPESAVRANELV